MTQISILGCGWLGLPLAKVLVENYGLGIYIGLVVGKPLGIFALTFPFVTFNLCQLPADLNWKNIFGAGILAGIGFTMSIFITLLAFDDETIINNSKLVILLSSLTAGLLGFAMLKLTLPTTGSRDE